MWDLFTQRLACKYTGQRQGRYIIRSCFGGVDGNLLASGSEGTWSCLYLQVSHFGSPSISLGVMRHRWEGVFMASRPCYPPRRPDRPREWQRKLRRVEPQEYAVVGILLR
jgi:hypothetical protein